jgi:thymidine kinase
MVKNVCDNCGKDATMKIRIKDGWTNEIFPDGNQIKACAFDLCEECIKRSFDELQDLIVKETKSQEIVSKIPFFGKMKYKLK